MRKAPGGMDHGGGASAIMRPLDPNWFQGPISDLPLAPQHDRQVRPLDTIYLNIDPLHGC